MSLKQSNFFFGSNRIKPKLNLFRLFFNLFCETKKHFFQFVSVLRTSIETNRILLKQTDKISQKTLSIRGSSKQLIFFLVRTETQSVSVVFQFLFLPNQKNVFGLFRCFRLESKQTELMVWGIKKVDILTNLLLFRLVFCLFRLFRNTETPCFDIKAKQPKQTSCFG